MPTNAWVLGTLFALAIAQLFVFWYLYRRVTVTSGGQVTTDSGAERTGSAGTDVVVCPECGIENDSSYRFCGNCASELPVQTGAVLGDSSPQQRGML